MRRNRLAALVMVSLLGAATAVLAAEAKSLEMTGNVKAVDLKARTVSIETGSMTELFKLGPGVSIDQQSPYKALTLEQIKVGEKVQVHYAMSGQDRVASRLEVLPVNHAANSPKPGSTTKRK